MNSCKGQTKVSQHNFALQAKTALLRRQMTITSLAKKLQRSRIGVSRAINHPNLLPALSRRVAKELAL